MYIRSQITTKNGNFTGLIKYSQEIFYNNDDFKALDPYIFENNNFRKLDKDDLPAKIKIEFKTYPFLNNYFIFLFDLYQLIKFSQDFFKIAINFDVLNILLTGNLGAGKTTFVKGFLNTSSPSFNIMNSFKIKDKIINHWDLYRIETDEENLKILDFWNILNESDTINLIEWANKIKLEFYINNCTNLIIINFSIIDDNKRIVTISLMENLINQFNQLLHL